MMRQRAAPPNWTMVFSLLVMVHLKVMTTGLSRTVGEMVGVKRGISGCQEIRITNVVLHLLQVTLLSK